MHSKLIDRLGRNLECPERRLQITIIVAFVLCNPKGSPSFGYVVIGLGRFVTHFLFADGTVLCVDIDVQ